MLNDDENYAELAETLISTVPPDQPPKQRRARRAAVAVSTALFVSALAASIAVLVSHHVGKARALGPTPSLTIGLGSLTVAPTMTTGTDQQPSSARPSSSTSTGQTSAIPSTFISSIPTSLPNGPIGSAPGPSFGQPTRTTATGGGRGPGPGGPGRGTASPHPSAVASTPVTYAEEAFNKHGVPTFSDYQNASGQGPDIPFERSVQVICKVYNTNIPSVLPGGYWYKIATAPWTDLYAAANTFLNGDPPAGPYSHNFDARVRNC